MGGKLFWNCNQANVVPPPNKPLHNTPKITHSKHFRDPEIKVPSYFMSTHQLWNNDTFFFTLSVRCFLVPSRLLASYEHTCVYVSVCTHIYMLCILSDGQQEVTFMVAEHVWLYRSLWLNGPQLPSSITSVKAFLTSCLVSVAGFSSYWIQYDVYFVNYCLH